MRGRIALLPVILVGMLALICIGLLTARDSTTQPLGQGKDVADKIPGPLKTGVPSPVPSTEPTYIPPVCELPFTDVAVTDSYYPGVRLLYCRGIRGYNSNPPCLTGTPCFRPADTMTRGQAAKVVDSLFMWPQPVTDGFTDVLPDSVFYDNIGHLKSAGAVFGYADDTFRPGEPISRGQFVKMAVVQLHLGHAFGWPMLNPIENTFEDVRRGSPYYSFVEMAAAQDTVHGYPCGGDGEPCGSGNKPYFRPNSAMNRAQASMLAFSLLSWYESR